MISPYHEVIMTVANTIILLQLVGFGTFMGYCVYCGLDARHMARSNAIAFDYIIQSKQER